MAANPSTSESTALAIRPSGAVALALESAGTVLGMNLLDMVATGRANLVTPAVMLDQVPAMHRLAVRVVTIDPKIETYGAPGKPGHVCLGATALQKVAMNAQVNWESVRQTDDWNDPYRIKYEAVGHVANLDGTRTRMAPGVVVIDLRGEPGWPVERLGADTREFLRQAEAAKQRKPMTFEIPPGTKSSTCRDCNRSIFWVPNPYKAGKTRPVDADGSDHWKTCPAKEQKGDEDDGWARVYQARQFIHRLAATKAMNAAIRKLGVPTSMPEERAAQPWVVMALVFDPPAEDPEIRRMLVAHKLGSQAALYGQPAAVAPAPAPAREPEPIDVSAFEEEPAPLATAEPWEAEPVAEATPCPLPVRDAVISACPSGQELRYRTLHRINDLYGELVQARGETEAVLLARKLATGIDWLAATMDELAVVGKGLKAELQGGGK